ncbi:MAG: hypothetical protein NTU53_15315 [Planctomycetota bacterium]|nr:hypothetical protein [Planctomycetota bacterium]
MESAIITSNRLRDIKITNTSPVKASNSPRIFIWGKGHCTCPIAFLTCLVGRVKKCGDQIIQNLGGHEIRGGRRQRYWRFTGRQ